jgi:hypothetical protein
MQTNIQKPILFSMLTAQVKAKEGTRAHLIVSVNTLDMSITTDVHASTPIAAVNLLEKTMPSYARENIRYTLNKIVEAIIFTFGQEALTKVEVSPAINVIDELLQSQEENSRFNSESWNLLPGERSVAYDAKKNPLTGGEIVKCIDDTEQGDSDSDFDLIKNQHYIVDEVHDEENLFSPMILLKGSNSGPVFPDRFIVEKQGS